MWKCARTGRGTGDLVQFGSSCARVPQLIARHLEMPQAYVCTRLLACICAGPSAVLCLPACGLINCLSCLPSRSVCVCAMCMPTVRGGWVGGWVGYDKHSFSARHVRSTLPACQHSKYTRCVHRRCNFGPSFRMAA